MRISDWSSDVCPSDLQAAARCAREARMGGRPSQGAFRADRSADGGTLAPAAGPGRVTGRFAVGWWLGHLARLDHMGCRGQWPPVGQAWRQLHPVRRVGAGQARALRIDPALRSEEHTSELQSLMRISYAVFCLKK